MQTGTKAGTLADLGQMRLVSCLFMGLGQIVYLKNYVMGIFYAAVELLTLLNLPGIIRKLTGLVTLGEANLSIPVTQRDHSIFMMIDGILVIGVLMLVAILYYVSVKSTVSEYKIVLRSGQLPTKERRISGLIENAFFGVAMSPALILIMVFVAGSWYHEFYQEFHTLYLPLQELFGKACETSARRTIG